MQHTSITTTKDRHSSSSRDLGIVLEESLDSIDLARGGVASYGYLDNMILENTSNYLQQQQQPQPLSASTSASYLTSDVMVGSLLPPLRRARAGTMPSSLAYMDSPPPMQSSANNFLNVTNNNNRHRSGSLTLPVPNSYTQTNNLYNNSGWSQHPTSPSTEQLLQGDDDFSIARTLRSIGLDDEDSNTPKITTSLRNRSYSVNNTPIYQQQQELSRPRLNHSTSLESSTTVANRRRASSMGRMDYSRLTPPGLSSLWKMQLDTLHDEEYSPTMEPSLSLGDSELLANMTLDNNSSNNISMIDNNNNSTMRASNNNNTFIPISTTAATVIAAPQPNNAAVSRSLWIGNIDASITVDGLTRLFSIYGPIESVRLLIEKECAFINFYHLEDAIHAKDDVLTNLGGRIGNCIVRIGYGRAETLAVTTPIEIPVVSQPTRALWLGNMPPNTTQAVLERVFSFFGVIESIRVLSHKNCAFINYDTFQSASDARDALLQNDLRVQDIWGVRIGFAKEPLATNSSKLKQSASNEEMNLATNSSNEQENLELWSLMKQFGASESASELVHSLQSASYFESIPPVPEYGLHRRHDAARLRDIRKKLDTVTESNEADIMAMDCMDELPEICSDYIGNTVVQRLFEKCSEDTKTIMLQSIAPHLAAMGVHKNGTWAAQKIIDSLSLPNQIQIVSTHIQPYIPPLLLDQFGNYVVQCCLRLSGDNTQYIMNAMVEKFVHIAQGRYGARAMRGILEGSLITRSQQIFIASALLQNAVSLSTHTNGTILTSWLIEGSQLKNRYTLLAQKLAPHLSQIAIHKLGIQILLKLINQDVDVNARDIILTALMENEDILREILTDQNRGLGFVTKVISSESLSADEKSKLREYVHPILMQLQGNGFKKALLEFVANNDEVLTVQEVEKQVAMTAVNL